MYFTHPFQCRNRFFCQPHWIQNVIVKNGLKKIVFTVCLKRRLAGHHFVHKHAKSPPVNGSVILQLLQDLSIHITTLSCELYNPKCKLPYVQYGSQGDHSFALVCLSLSISTDKLFWITLVVQQECVWVWVKVLCPARHKICHFRDVLPSQFLVLALTN